MRQNSLSGRAEQDASWYGIENFEGIDSFLVQPFVPYHIRGSIVEHPNLSKGVEDPVYLINFVYKSQRSPYGLVEEFITDSNGEVLRRSGFNQEVESDEKNKIREVIELKRGVRELGFIDSNYSSQMEFIFPKDGKFEGVKTPFYRENPYSTQERAFLKFEFKPDLSSQTYHFNQFGIPKSEEYKIVRLSEQVGDYFDPFNSELNFLPDIEKLLDTDEKTIFILSHPYAFNPICRFHPKNLSGVINPISGGGSNSLEHGSYRNHLMSGFTLGGFTGYEFLRENNLMKVPNGEVVEIDFSKSQEDLAPKRKLSQRDLEALDMLRSVSGKPPLPRRTANDPPPPLANWKPR